MAENCCHCSGGAAGKMRISDVHPSRHLAGKVTFVLLCKWVLVGCWRNSKRCNLPGQNLELPPCVTSAITIARHTVPLAPASPLPGEEVACGEWRGGCTTETLWHRDPVKWPRGCCIIACVARFESRESEKLLNRQTGRRTHTRTHSRISTVVQTWPRLLRGCCGRDALVGVVVAVVVMTVAATIETGGSGRFWCRLSLPLVTGPGKRFWLSAPSRSYLFFLSSQSFFETSALSTIGCCPPISSLVWFSLFLTLLLPRKIFFEGVWWSWDVLPFYLEMYPCHVSLRHLPAILPCVFE